MSKSLVIASSIHVFSVWSTLEKFFVLAAGIYIPLIIIGDMRLR
jgi:hypothetical protein